jgi:hypothetical protein
MTADGKPNSPSERSQSAEISPKASNYDMFEGLHQTRLKATEANRRRLLAGNAPLTPSAPEEKIVFMWHSSTSFVRLSKSR